MYNSSNLPNELKAASIHQSLLCFLNYFVPAVHNPQDCAKIHHQRSAGGK
jgi:hypothetical protein